MKLSRNKAFTLVELIIVIAVIGVLAAILIPVFSNVIKKANAKSALADARNAVSMYVTESLDKRVHGDTSSPENITIIVEKGGRYYAFGYNTAESSSILVSNANEDGMSASDLDALINDHSFNVQNGGTYDPDTTYTLSDGAFYLVPYTGTTPDNTNVRGFVSSESASGNFLRLDEENAGYGFDLNVGDTTAVFHGCLVKGTYDTVSATANNSNNSNNGNNGNNGGGDETPVTHTVTFAISGVDNEDEANVVIKQNGTPVTGSSVTITGDTTPVTNFSAEYPYTEGTDDHWYTIASLSPASGFITSDVTITFTFNRHDAERYSVTYDANGGSGSTTDSATYLATQIVTLKENGFTAPAHKHFDGWRVGDLTKQPGDTFVITANTTITAQWANDAQYTISFNANGGTGTMGDVTRYGGSYELPSCGFTRTGYHFTGWKANNTGETMPATSSYDVSAAVTFYAQWEKDTYTVNFYANGSLHASSTVDHGDTVSAPANPSKTGYTFRHWSLTNNGADATTGDAFSLSTAITGNTNLYAVWQINSYTVTFTDGTNSQNKSYNYNTTITLAEENPLTAPSGKEFDKFTVGGADATTLTVTAATTVTVVWKNQAAAGVDCTFHITYCNYNGNKPFYGSNWDMEGVHQDYVKNCSPGEVTITMAELVAAGKFAPDMNGKYYIGTTQGSYTDLLTEWNVTVVAGTTEYSFNIYTLPQVGTRPTSYNGVSNTRSLYNPNTTNFIGTYAELLAIGSEEANLDMVYTLVDDIEIDTTLSTWVPLGFGLGQNGTDVPFTGEFYGDGNAITGLEIDMGDPVVVDQTTTYYQNVGLFAIIGDENHNGKVQDLVVRTSENGVEGGMVVGILAGQNAGTIDNVTITGPINSEDPTVTDSAYVGAYAPDYYSYVGTIVGHNEGTIHDCTVTGAKVYGYVEVGGAVGENIGGTIYNTDITIDDINAQATESTLQSMGMNYIGGFVGLNDSGYIYNCNVSFNNSGIVKGYYYVGGFVGENTKNTTTANSAKIENCEVTGAEVYGRRYVGGFCGYNESMSETYKAEITECDITIYGINAWYYDDPTLASILADTGFVGGFVGYNNGTVDDCSAEFYHSLLAGFQRVGGFAGKNDTLGEITLSAAKTVFMVGYQFVGGFCGENFGAISQSYANIYGLNKDFTNSDLTTTQPSFVGGLIGASRGTVANCYAIAQNVVKGYNYVGGLMGANYSGGSATNCFSHVTVLGATAAYSVAYVNSATMSGIFFVANQGTSTGATRVSESNIKASTFENTAVSVGWSTSIWDFTTGGYPDLVNNPR